MASKSVLPRWRGRAADISPDMLARPAEAHHGGAKKWKANAAPQPPHDSGVWHREFAARREARRLKVTRADGPKPPDASKTRGVKEAISTSRTRWSYRRRLCCSWRAEDRGCWAASLIWACAGHTHTHTHTRWSRSVLIFERKFSILVALFISEQSRPSARRGRENCCACLSVQSPSDEASLNLCSTVCLVVWGALLDTSFLCLHWTSSKLLCLSESFLCLRKYALRSFTCNDCVGNVCEAKVATDTRLFRRSSPQPTSHLHKSYCFFPWPSDLRSQCLWRHRSGKGKPNILLPFDQSKGLGFQRWRDRRLASFASDRK